MKPQRKTSSNRDSELLQAFIKKREELSRTNARFTRSMLVKEVLEHSRPHYNVTLSHAYRTISQLKLHGFPRGWEGRERYQMWKEILTKVERVLEKNPKLSIGQAVTRVIMLNRASRFFISMSYAYKTLYRLEHEERVRDFSNRA